MILKLLLDIIKNQNYVVYQTIIARRQKHTGRNHA